MPRIIVLSEPTDAREAVALDERVACSELEGSQHAVQLVERLGWAIHDADQAESGSGPTSRPAPSTPSAGTGGAQAPDRRLADVAHAVREHEDATRSALSPARLADRRLYRRLRQAFVPRG